MAYGWRFVHFLLAKVNKQLTTGVRSKSLPWLHGQYPGIAKPVLKVRVKNQATPNNTPLFRSKSNGINLELEVVRISIFR
jgi:hypothetical protein